MGLTRWPCLTPCSVRWMVPQARLYLAAPTGAVVSLLCSDVVGAIGVSLRDTHPGRPLLHKRGSMAHLHFRRTVYKSGGAAATQRLSYITRQPVHELSRAEQQLRYIGHGEDSGRQREDLLYTNHRNLPVWSHDNPHVYFQAAERHEGKNRVAFTEMKISLPQELSHRENMALTRDLVDTIAGENLPVVYAFHDPMVMDESARQPHLHLLISARRTDEHLRTPEQHFRKFNRAHPEQGGAEKDPASWHFGSVRASRVMVSDIINIHMEQSGYLGRIDPRSLEAQGIARKPEPKLLPSESRQYREHGVVSETMQQVLDIRADRAQHAEREQADAQQYWTERKQQFGITADMPMAQRLQLIRAAREQAITCAPERPGLPQ